MDAQRVTGSQGSFAGGGSKEWGMGTQPERSLRASPLCAWMGSGLLKPFLRTRHLSAAPVLKVPGTAPP